MQKFILFFLTGFSFLYAQEKATIAVMELDAEGISPSEARIITARLRIDLFNTNNFIVLERDKVEEILNEQGFQQSGCTTNECVVEVGKLIGVQKMVAGDIGKIGKLITLSIRMIDVQTGQVVKTATSDCECPIEKVVTESVGNVAQILAGAEINSSLYEKRQDPDNFRRQNIEMDKNDGAQYYGSLRFHLFSEFGEFDDMFPTGSLVNGLSFSPYFNLGVGILLAEELLFFAAPDIDFSRKVNTVYLGTEFGAIDNEFYMSIGLGYKTKISNILRWNFEIGYAQVEKGLLNIATGIMW